MQGPLAFSLNDDGTITLRCNADAFFAHANTIRQLLTGADEEEPTGDTPFTSFWGEVFPERRARRSSDLSGPNAELLAVGYYLTRERGFEAFTRGDLQALLGTLEPPRDVATGTLIHMARRGWLERVRRGAYRLTRRAFDRIESLRQLEARPAAQARAEPALPSIIGLSRFLREVPANRKWRKVLLVAYFLSEHCNIEEFDARLLSACFKRVRGTDVPGSLPSLISQTLYKRHGVLERGSKRGRYALKQAAIDELRREPRIAQANAAHRAKTVAKTG